MSSVIRANLSDASHFIIRNSLIVDNRQRKLQLASRSVSLCRRQRGALTAELQCEERPEANGTRYRKLQVVQNPLSRGSERSATSTEAGSRGASPTPEAQSGSPVEG